MSRVFYHLAEKARKHSCECCCVHIASYEGGGQYREHYCMASGYAKVLGYEVDADTEWGWFVTASDPHLMIRAALASPQTAEEGRKFLAWFMKNLRVY